MDMERACTVVQLEPSFYVMPCRLAQSAAPIMQIEVYGQAPFPHYSHSHGGTGLKPAARGKALLLQRHPLPAIIREQVYRSNAALMRELQIKAAGLPRRYAFPGNITELRDLVERAAVQAGEATPQLNADLFWFATQASLANPLFGCIPVTLLERCLLMSSARA